MSANIPGTGQLAKLPMWGRFVAYGAMLGVLVRLLIPRSPQVAKYL